MEDLTTTKHPLLRGGTSRTRRTLAAASPATAPLDGRSEAEWLEYVFQLAKTVIYHDHETLRKSNWQDFFQFALPFQLALIARFDLDFLQKDFEAAEISFENGLEKGNLEPLFARVLDLVRLCDRWHGQLPERSGLKTLLFGLIDEDLRFSLDRFSRLAQQMNAAKIGFEEPTNWRLAFQNKPWVLSALPISINGSGGLRGSVSMKKQAARAQLHEFFQIFQQGLRRAVEAAPRFLDESLTSFSDYAPQVGLMLAFFKLFKNAQTDLNLLTERQLHFYYRDVLGLHEKPAVPDAAHLLLQLDKGVLKHPLAAATRFKDGKDANKADVFFKSDEQIVLNQAAVESLRTVHRTTNSILAAPQANSADGLGKPFDEPEKATWKTLGGNQATFPTARIGFVIASPTLLLNEANGDILIDFVFEKIHFELPTRGFDVFYSSKKGWEKAKKLDFSTKNQLKISLATGDAPLTQADEKVLKTNFGTTEPMLKIELTKPNAAFESAKIKSIKITTTAHGLRNLILSNDDGPLDPNKPFQPFGAQPHSGSACWVGCEEAFRKQNLTALGFKIEWDKKPDFAAHYAGFPTNYRDESNYLFNLSLLKKGVETPANATTNTLFPDKTVDFSNGLTDFMPLTEPLLPFSNLSKNGFFKLSLANQDFGHAIYPQLLTDFLLQNATGKINPTAQTLISDIINSNKFGDTSVDDIDKTTANSLLETAKNRILINDSVDPIHKIFTPIKPNEPYTPTIRSFSVSYTAQSTWSAAVANDIQFFHVHPFEPENHEKQDFENGLPALFPNFLSEGQLLIGLKNALPGSTLALLFQLAEATADPNGEAAKLTWSYLTGNRWNELKPVFHILSDATDGLIGSGIVHFSMPFDWSNDGTTILPNALFWLKVETLERTAAISEAIFIAAQAVKTTFDPSPENDLSRLAEPFNSLKINRLETKNAAIKKVEQPFESFGGQPNESAEQFYRRAGERLRHKGRAISLFDYERLVLEAFPTIFQAKCLTHTQINAAASPDFYIAPGHVAVAVIPDMKRFGFAARLQPTASRVQLKRIHDFLEKRSSPFVRLKVVNPIYEAVVVETQVVFQPNFDADFYKNKLETEDLVAFFNPWAFDQPERLAFGGKLFRSEVLRFVEKLEYVDFVLDFKVYHASANAVEQESPVVEVRSARSILASGKHKIEVISLEEAQKRIENPTATNGFEIGKFQFPEKEEIEVEGPCGTLKMTRKH